MRGRGKRVCNSVSWVSLCHQCTLRFRHKSDQVSIKIVQQHKNDRPVDQKKCLSPQESLARKWGAPRKMSSTLTQRRTVITSLRHLPGPRNFDLEITLITMLTQLKLLPHREGREFLKYLFLSDRRTVRCVPPDITCRSLSLVDYFPASPSVSTFRQDLSVTWKSSTQWRDTFTLTRLKLRRQLATS